MRSVGCVITVAVVVVVASFGGSVRADVLYKPMPKDPTERYVMMSSSIL